MRILLAILLLTFAVTTFAEYESIPILSGVATIREYRADVTNGLEGQKRRNKDIWFDREGYGVIEHVYNPDNTVGFRIKYFYNEGRLSEIHKIWLISADQFNPDQLGIRFDFRSYDSANRLTLVREATYKGWDSPAVLELPAESYEFHDWMGSNEYVFRLSKTWKMLGTTIRIRNLAGQVVESRQYSSEGGLLEKRICTYNTRGLIWTETITPAGKNPEKFTYLYDYDSKGNWTKLTALREPLPVPPTPEPSADQSAHQAILDSRAAYILYRVIEYAEPP